MSADKILKYTSEQFEVDVRLLIKVIQNSLSYCEYHKPAISRILAPERGGLVLGVYLSHAFNVPLTPLSKRDNDYFVDLVSAETALGKQILLVDDIVDTGKTFQEIYTIYKTNKAFNSRNLFTVSLFYNPKQPIKVDFYSHIIDRSIDKRWVEFPHESVKHVLE